MRPLDLPIALGILAATRQVPPKALLGLEFAGELALSGELRPIRGALAMMLAAHLTGQERLDRVEGVARARDRLTKRK